MRSCGAALVACLLLHHVLSFRGVGAAEEAAEVKGLAGQPSVSFRHYAGYVSVAHGRALFYWFFQADQAEASQLPLAVWFNGGPGCSSVGNGALSELGPFYTNPAGNGLIVNPFSWTKAANIIFVESPVSTGFSYSNVTSDYDQFSDEAIAEDAYSFLLGWFDKFPEYKPNDFYLLGESYAGHYVPTLARLITQRNKSPVDQMKVINFRGFAIGNPWTDAALDNAGTTDFYRSHSLISDETFSAIQAHCDYATELPVDASSSDTLCSRAVAEANSDMAQIDVYNIYATSCNSNGSTAAARDKKAAYHLTAAYNPSCVDSVTPYLNMPEVQRALHVISPVTWSGCSNVVYTRYKREDIVASMLPVYQELLQEGLKILIYSGDVDGVVATSATRSWIKALNLTIEMSWYAWNHQNQVGGWTQKYTGLTFATVRGAGHMVPATKPAQALALFESFLAGGMLPSF